MGIQGTISHLLWCIRPKQCDASTARSREELLSHAEHDICLSSVDRAAFVATLKGQRAFTNFERRLRRNDDSPVWVLENATLGRKGR